jgi:excisionase family DNA binding protein
MDDLVIMKASELKEMFAGITNEIKKLRKDFQDYKTKEETEAFTIKEAANKLSVSYWTVRRLIKHRELQPLYLVGDCGHYRISATSIRIYIEKKTKNSKNI